MNDTTHVPGQRRDPTTRTWLFLGAGVAAVLVLLVLVAVACRAPDRAVTAGDSGAATAPAGSGGLGSGQQPGGEQEDAAAAAAQDPDGQDGGAGSPSGQEGPGGQPDPSGPVIETFEVLQQPQCPQGTDNYQLEGQPVVLAWQVTGADGDQVSLSIDGPGVYNTYPADGGDTINFPCEGEPGDVQEHTYLLTAVGDGETATQTLVVTAEVKEVTGT